MQCYVIADCTEDPPDAFFERIVRLVNAGAGWFQLRAKTLDDGTITRAATRMRRVIPKDRARLMINSRPDIALAVGAEGVHLPAAGLPISSARSIAPGLIVGRSCHSLEDCHAAFREGADYVVLGPVFPARSKQSEALVSLDDLERASRLGLVFALGGISRSNFRQFHGLPLAGLAAITMFMKDDDVEEAIAEIREL